MQQSAGYYKKIGLDALRGRWGLAVLVSFIAGLLGAGGSATGQITQQVNSEDVQSFLWSLDPQFATALIALMASLGALLALYGIVLFVIGGAVELGQCGFYTGLIRGEYVTFQTLFARFHVLLKAFLLRLYMGLFIFLWTLLLFIPGIVATYRYAMAPYILADNPEIGVVEAVNRSKAMMKGNKGLLFWLQLSFIGWAILCIFTLGIGYLWLTPYMQASQAAFYLELRELNLRDGVYDPHYAYNS